MELGSKFPYRMSQKLACEINRNKIGTTKFIFYSKLSSMLHKHGKEKQKK